MKFVQKKTQKGGVMKKLLFLTILFLVSSALLADCYLNNGNMESWTQNGSGGPPDNWSVTSSSLTASQETTTIHGGSYSTNLTWTTTSTVRFEQTGISITEGNDYEFCFYAYDNDPAGRVRVVIRWYDSGGSLISGFYGDYSTDSAGWQYLRSGAQTAPSGAVTANVEIRCYDVSDDWDGDATVYVDDATFCDNSCLAVNLSSFYATLDQEGLTLHWKTYSETNNQGWNVYRATENDFNLAEKINVIQIPGNGTTNEISEYTYPDNSVQEDGTYYYWIESVENSGNTELYNPISITINKSDDNQTPGIPNVTYLKNYPNPFNPTTIIEFIAPEGKNAKLSIYNLKGQEIITLFEGISQGHNYITWDGKDKYRNQQGSGIYLYKLVTENNTITKKMVLMK